MNNLRIHYDPQTGKIVGSDNSRMGPPLLNSQIVEFTIEEGHEIAIDPTSQKINIVTLELETMSDDEIRIERGPKDWQLKQAVSSELLASDAMIAPDRPIDNRDAWNIYRQALRDVSKLTNEHGVKLTPFELVKAFPIRPNGIDPIPDLRAKLLT